MDRIRRCGLGAAMALCLPVSGATAGVAAQEPPSRDALLGAAREVVEAARYCGLVTFDDTGSARVRVMDPFPPDEDWSIWMGTTRDSRKVRDIQGDPRVTLYCYAADLVGYVTISGTARLVDDPAEKSVRWKEDWEAIYTDREAQYVLIRMIPERLEVISLRRGISGDPETWEPPSVTFGPGD